MISLMEQFTAASPALPYINRLDTSSTLGWHQNVLYDAIDPNEGDGPVTVGAHIFDVSCGVVPFQLN